MIGTESISAPCQIIAEGAADEAFFERLLSARGIGDFQVRCARCNADPGRCAGKAGFLDTLRGLLSATVLKPDTINGIILAIDSDTNPDVAFKEIRDIWKICRPMRPHPDQALEIRDTDPAICIMLIPWLDRTGNLDTLLYESAAASHADLVPLVEEFCIATKHRNGDWPDGVKGKMKLRCVIAASHRPDPGLSLAYLIRGSKCPFDFAGRSFDQIAAFLRDFRGHVMQAKESI